VYAWLKPPRASANLIINNNLRGNTVSAASQASSGQAQTQLPTAVSAKQPAAPPSTASSKSVAHFLFSIPSPEKFYYSKIIGSYLKELDNFFNLT
jgi:hypothetical protein